MKKIIEPRPIIIGEDRELANILAGQGGSSGLTTGSLAARLLLKHVPGVSPGGGYETSEIDWGRLWLVNGSCIYIDSGHLETATAECADAFQFAAASRAMLRIVRRAMHRVNALLKEAGRDVSVEVFANNSDGRGHSWGSHISFLIPRKWFNDLLERRPHLLGYLASMQASSLVFEGAGKVGSENGAPDVVFQISQRGDFFECITSTNTMFHRPLVNARDEALCGFRSPELARLHAIGKDSTLCQTATVLKAGVMQLCLALLATGGRELQQLELDDPVAAARNFSHDPDLRTEQKLANGNRVTAVEHQLLNAEAIDRWLDRSESAELMVPRAREILALYVDTLEKLKRRDFEALAPRLDWVLKKMIIERAIERTPGLDWSARDRLKVLDHNYSHLDHGKGLFWPCEEAGTVDKLVADEEIDRLMTRPPEHTRAWTRGTLLSLAEPADVYHVDWDGMTLDVSNGGFCRRSLRVEMDNPCGFNRGALPRLESCATLGEAADYLDGALEREPSVRPAPDRAPPPPPLSIGTPGVAPDAASPDIAGEAH